MATKLRTPTDADLIDQLGGNTVVARLLTAETGETVEPGTVGQMKFKKKIPDYLRPTFAKLLISQGITPPAGFAQVKPRRRRTTVS